MHLLQVIATYACRLYRVALPITFAAFGLALWGVDSTTHNSASGFSLPDRKTGALIDLDDFSGKIVVLDFFAYWCRPCKPLSTDLEKDIQQYYAGRQGNAARVPVQVISINIEEQSPAYTDEFIEETGAGLVLNDYSSSTFKAYGATGLPFIVVVDATHSAEFKVILRHAGHPGIGRLRETIDAIRPSEPPADPVPTASAPVDAADETPQARIRPFGVHTASADFEALLASDVALTQSIVQYRLTTGRSRWDLAFGYNTMEMDVVSPDPFFLDIFSPPTSFREDRFSLQANGRFPVADRLLVLTSVGYYNGFLDYRSAWLNTYYSHVGSLLSGYPDADPRGYNGSAGLRWEYPRGTGFLQGEFGYLKDHIPPSAEFERTTLLGRDVLDTMVYRLSSENVLSPRHRSRLEWTITDTSERSIRHGVTGALNWALWENWVFRSAAGVVIEEPDFHAYQASAVLGYRLSPAWSINATFRYYQDSGEIQESIPLSDAPPALNSRYLTFGIRYLGRRISFKLSGGPYLTRYDPVESVAPFFEDLYRSRHWWLIQTAIDVRF